MNKAGQETGGEGWSFKWDHFFLFKVFAQIKVFALAFQSGKQDDFIPKSTPTDMGLSRSLS